MLVAAAVSFASTPMVKALACKVGAIDVPKDNRRMHKVPIPRMGGLAIFLAFLLSVLVFADIDRQMQGILLGSIMIVILGVLDDIMALKALPKLFVQIAAAGVAVWHGCTIQFVSNPNVFSEATYLNLGWLSIPVTIIWIVAITNAVNFIDGLDGLAVGVSAISTASLIVVALMVKEVNIAVILCALFGACLGFIPYNMNPAKIFMVVKEVSGKSAKDWITEYMILELKGLLTNSTLNIQEIVEKTQFSNQSSLGRFFRRHTGLSPLQYRKKYLTTEQRTNFSKNNTI